MLPHAKSTDPHTLQGGPNSQDGIQQKIKPMYVSSRNFGTFTETKEVYFDLASFDCGGHQWISGFSGY